MSYYLKNHCTLRHPYLGGISCGSIAGQQEEEEGFVVRLGHCRIRMALHRVLSKNEQKFQRPRVPPKVISPRSMLTPALGVTRVYLRKSTPSDQNTVMCYIRKDVDH